VQCPKCESEMEEIECSDVTIDRCVGCQGIWFDRGEVESLSSTWVAEFIDTGDTVMGEQMSDIDDISCPRCGKQMRRFFDISESQLQFEECDEYGKFFDAGEFTLWAENQYL